MMSKKTRTINILSSILEATLRVGQILASYLSSGDVLLLVGDLGAGKTALTQGLASVLVPNAHISSPTFTLVCEHVPPDLNAPALFHFDAYRLDGSEDFVASGLDEYFDRHGICVIEWGEKVEDLFLDDIWRLSLDGTKDQRHIALCIPRKKEGLIPDLVQALGACGLMYDVGTKPC